MEPRPAWTGPASVAFMGPRENTTWPGCARSCWTCSPCDRDESTGAGAAGHLPGDPQCAELAAADLWAVRAGGRGDRLCGPRHRGEPDVVPRDDIRAAVRARDDIHQPAVP